MVESNIDPKLRNCQEVFDIYFMIVKIRILDRSVDSLYDILYIEETIWIDDLFLNAQLLL